MEKFLAFLPTISKALVAGIVPILLGWLALIGIDQNMTVKDALGLLLSGVLTGAITWVVPNTKKG